MEERPWILNVPKFNKVRNTIPPGIEARDLHKVGINV